MTNAPTGDVLVLGVGFVGSYVLAEATQAGLSVCGVDRHPTTLANRLGANPRARILRADLTDRDITRRLLREVRPRALVLTSRLEDDHGSFGALVHLIDNAAATGASRIILISSLAVYGAAFASGGLLETTHPVNPSPYGLSKLAEEEAVAKAAQDVGMSYLVLRSCGLFGRLPIPRDSNRSAGAIDRAVRQYVVGRPPELAVEDMPDQYLYCRELGLVVVEALKRPPTRQVMNVGPGHLLEPEDVQDALKSTLNVNVTLRRQDRTGRAVHVLNVEHLNAWHPEREDMRSELTHGLAATLRDFGM